MSPLERRRDDEEESGGVDSGPVVETEPRVCVVCRQELPAWVRRCPDDGARTVPRMELPAAEEPALQRLLRELGEEGDAAPW
ncbi:MAG: hypothetical protein KY462_06055 [Actinobacteria bacterium]|nr:hypothetical protein [Actinomycetota bacterium]